MILNTHKRYDIRIYADSFYTRNWFEPTEGSVDIFRDDSICNDSVTYSLESLLHFCINVYSGKYCLGFGPLDFRGNMEHITGKLIKPLEKGKPYVVTFYIKYL